MKTIKLTATVCMIAASLAEPLVVVEHRRQLETWVQPLEARDGSVTCVINGLPPVTKTCFSNQACCSGACIPYDAICCGSTWCPSSLTCFPPLSIRYNGDPDCIQRYSAPAFTSIVITSQAAASFSSTGPSTLSQSGSPGGSGSSSLSTGSIVGISVSVACSVLGLLFGVGFKIWAHRRKEKRELARLQAAEIQPAKPGDNG